MKNIEFKQFKTLHILGLVLIYNSPTAKMKTCIDKISKIFQMNKVDHTHGIDHALIVVQHGRKAIQAAPELTQQQKQDILLACLLHDADDKKYFPTHKNYQNARRILMEEKVDQKRIQNIIGMISCVSFSKNGDTIDPSKQQFWYYPRYCDRIDAIGYKGLVRSYEYALHAKNPIFCNQTQKPLNLQQLNRVCAGREQLYIKKGGSSNSFIDHIYDKLLHLKLPQFIKNPYLIQKYKEGKQEIIDFVLRHAPTNLQLVQKQMQDYIKQRDGKVNQKMI